jgi:hypothetical protein
MRSPGLKTLLAAAAITLAAAAPAAADSIAYVKGGDVYLTTSDGARQYRVTDTGGYSTVSQADDGTLIATAGNRLRRIDPEQGVTHDFATPVSDDRPAGQRMFYGPYDATISPDGSKVAYGFYAYLSYFDYSCNCVKYKWKQGTAYTKPDRNTGWDDPYKWVTGWTGPSFLDNTWSLNGVGPGYPSDDVYVHNAETGAGNTWFSDRSAYSSLKDGEMSRDFKNMAFVGDTSNATGKFLQLYRATAAPTSGQVFRCNRFEQPTGEFSSPSFSPEGRRLAFADGDGIYVVGVGDGSDCAQLTPPSAPLIAGASSPDWGPADVPVPPAQEPDPTPTPDPVTDPTPVPSPAPSPSPGPGKTVPSPLPGPGKGTPAPTTKDGGIVVDRNDSAKPLPSAVLAVKAGKATRKGVTLTVTAPAAGKIAAAAALKGKAVLAGSAKAAGAGTVTLRLKPTKAGRKALKKGAKVTVTVTQGTAKATVKVKLAR